MAFFLRHLEIWLSLVGVGLILLVPAVVGTDRWYVTAMTAIGVGLLHVAIFWLVRQRQRQVREQTISEIRGMLKHLINNSLCTISLHTGLMADKAANVREILISVDRVTNALRNISEERLTEWRDGLAQTVAEDAGPRS